jgi:hypothetical protein
MAIEAKLRKEFDLLLTVPESLSKEGIVGL